MITAQTLDNVRSRSRPWIDYDFSLFVTIQTVKSYILAGTRKKVGIKFVGSSDNNIQLYNIIIYECPGGDACFSH